MALSHCLTVPPARSAYTPAIFSDCRSRKSAYSRISEASPAATPEALCTMNCACGATMIRSPAIAITEAIDAASASTCTMTFAR